MDRGPRRSSGPPGGPRGSGDRRPPYDRDRDRDRGWDRDRRPSRPPYGRSGAFRPPPAYRQPALPPPDALGPEEELVAGRRPVEEAFVARRPAIRLLVVPQRRAALEKLVLHATNLRIPIVEVEGGSLTALAGFDGHQGIALVVEPRRFASLDDILARAAERGEPPFVLVLDSLEDPHNVGSLLRSAEAAGVHGVVFPTHRQAPLSPSAVKASAGAIEHLQLSPADDLPAALSDLHSRGLRIAGADGGAPLSARQTDLRGPLAIVVGSEGQGLRPAVRRRCDVFMRIPMKGAVGSLNVAVAGSILLFEALSQREDVEGLPSPAPAESSSPGEPSTRSPRPAPKSPKARAKKVAVEATPADQTRAETTPQPEADADLLPGDSAPKAPKTPKAAKAPTTAKVAKSPKTPTRRRAARTEPDGDGESTDSPDA
jgi:23S rRNA (guanosine2251-2'-O)-methyltransferase